MGMQSILVIGPRVANALLQGPINSHRLHYNEQLCLNWVRIQVGLFCSWCHSGIETQKSNLMNILVSLNQKFCKEKYKVIKHILKGFLFSTGLGFEVIKLNILFM